MKKKVRKWKGDLKARMGGLINTMYVLIKLFELWF